MYAIINTMNIIKEALQKGIQAHKSGKIKEADQYYTAIIEKDPSHPDANHNMGVLAVGLGRPDVALPFFKKALESKKYNIAVCYIEVLIKLKKFNEAKKSLKVKLEGFEDP